MRCTQHNPVVPKLESNPPTSQIPDVVVEEGEEGETVDIVEDDDNAAMMAMMGLGNFGSTKVRFQRRAIVFLAHLLVL